MTSYLMNVYVGGQERLLLLKLFAYTPMEHSGSVFEFEPYCGMSFTNTFYPLLITGSTQETSPHDWESV